jgi:hypothetical protein
LDKKSESISDFEIIEIDKEKALVVLEDRDIGLQAKVSGRKNKLADAKIVGPYEIKLIYADGSTELQKILN